MPILRAALRRPFEALLTLAVVMVALRILVSVADWGIVRATWTAENRSGCAPGGACWAFVIARFNQFIYGFYPRPEQWRVSLFFLQIALLFAAFVIKPGLLRRSSVATLCALSIPASELILLHGGWFGLAEVPTREWGGLMLTFVMALSSALFAFPLAVLLALGRRSPIPSVRVLATASIEFWRAVPILAVVFLASVLLPLVMPQGVTIDRLLRAIVGLGLVFSAYMAEAIRGGLQAVPQGHYEAAAALGLRYWRTIASVILPQAFRTALPALTNEFNSIVKNTTLVLVVSLFELLGSVQAALNDPNWIGLSAEGYVFAALVFWLLCFGISQLSAVIERRMNRGRGR